jgi:uncharacterized membrane protein
LHADFESVEKDLKKYHFSILLMFVKLVLLITFFGACLQFFQRIRNQREILRFFYIFLIFAKKTLFILALFENFAAKRTIHGSTNQKTYLVNVS